MTPLKSFESGTSIKRSTSSNNMFAIRSAYGKQVARYALYAFWIILYLIIAPKVVVGQLRQERLNVYFDAKSQRNSLPLFQRGVGGIFMHIVFQEPQDWIRHLKECVPRGRILVITLVFTAGIVTIAATMLKKSAKDEELQADVSRIQLKLYLIQAGLAGIRVLKKDSLSAIQIALQTYAKQRGVDWDGNLQKKDASPVSLRIGTDTVTVTASHQGDKALMEIRAICGSEGAKVVVGPAGVLETTIFDTREVKAKPTLLES